MRGRLWTTEEIDDLRQSYASEAAASIAKRLGHATLGVYMKAGLLGLKRQTLVYTPRANAWTATDIQVLRELYPTMPTREVAERLGRSVATVHVNARKLGVAKTNISFRYHSRSDAFSVLAPDSAYVLGFILADGNITKTRNNQVLQIASTDLDIMEKMAAILGTNKPIHRRFNKKATKPSYHLAINDYQILADLARLGITPRKSLTATMPDVPDILFFHFLRGYFDGDGTVQFNIGKGLAMSVTSGSEYLLRLIEHRVRMLLDIPKRTIWRPFGSVNGWRLGWNGLLALLIANAMYADAEGLFLQRKKEPFDRYAVTVI